MELSILSEKQGVSLNFENDIMSQIHEKIFMK